ncbi:unnamed protein product (macronuclear) [Paramecium tetraurelia]|uniref:Protein kinase domain-containing protein n=1 Tax=Paramecium tetraurelia TaxID=5888 RepID=A0BD64_PARTE|nr:uncharacterized protein GSPATT00004575001 [Paramecium tetraurelia]CAK56481.1 unnamed protein product [Paramecium tetraurelia]|eukprot:XP_001423879.1 hypothetical protein (macronuclear) [Paramecium tetraurelia strain d4-2]
MHQKLWIPIPNDFKPKQEHLIIQGEFTKPNGKTRLLYGYDHYVVCVKDGQFKKCIKLEFDTKFEILRQAIQKKDEDDDSLGPIIGIQFLRDNAGIMPTYKLSASSKLILEWRQFLSPRINQWQFHNMFRVYKKIGKGNFATVYMAERIEDGEEMAIKAFAKQAAYAEENGKEAILNEIAIMRRLHNKHLMKLFEVYETSNSLYVALELLEGGSLYDLIKDKVPINTKQIQQIMVGILIGLQEMHKKEIMHRDLKLENILFKVSKKMESVVIADFGLATHVNEPVYLYCRCGTPGYVAPEVINIKDMKSKYSSICDIYSLGLVFYLLLTGKPAFNGKSYATVVKQNREASVDFEIKQLQNAPGAAVDLLKQMLEKDPKKRINAEKCLHHAFLSDMAKIMLEAEKEDQQSIDEIDEGNEIQNMMNKINDEYSKFDATRNINSPLQSPKQSPGLLMQKQIQQQKQIDSTKVVGHDSPLLKGKVDSIDSAQSIGTPTKKNNQQYQPSPQIKPSRFAKQAENNPLLKYAKKD